jgi:hypothetical protein
LRGKLRAHSLSRLDDDQRHQLELLGPAWEGAQCTHLAICLELLALAGFDKKLGGVLQDHAVEDVAHLFFLLPGDSWVTPGAKVENGL